MEKYTKINEFIKDLKTNWKDFKKDYNDDLYYYISVEVDSGFIYHTDIKDLFNYLYDNSDINEFKNEVENIHQALNAYFINYLYDK